MMYLFILGREQLLSRAEVEHVLTREGISFRVEKQVKDQFLVSADAFDEPALMAQLGGTVKLARFAAEMHDPVDSIADYLLEAQPEGKIRFSLTGASNAVAIQVKKKLKAKERSVRYIVPKNTATIIHNNLDKKKGDLTIFGHNLFATCAVQDIESFGKRDYDRPASDNVSGMLPPKLCRMMINLLSPKEHAVLLDPFCGSGTVLMEAMMLGYTKLIGTDVSEKAISDTKTNLAWMKKEYAQTSGAKETLHVQAVESLSSKLPPNSVDHIVFEPYMGPPRKGNESIATLEATAQEIFHMFKQAFGEFQTILKEDGSIVCIVPRFLVRRESVVIPIRTAFTDNGFEIVPLLGHDHLMYKRAGQHVGREIWKLKKSQ